MQQERPSRNEKRDPAAENAETREPEGSQRREQLADDTDSTLEEIDDVLEEDAEQFVRSYVQKGGQ
ncbi:MULTISPECIES: ubiquitin-like protein Pup [Actinopolyspora]|uniref:Prokaryotic ubiquitin-like protein Pup n=1 Tax=Actinopolyspora saharensis TaxID=995062 RepID=A0A1H0ZH32_9ACTN|nr:MULTISPECIES: ubiquitin-like protein Pup [Actinopolyspora]NHD15793.1 ubiquitin-like protein Pup [Actinopolyspora sp. BKK2]NHE74993.1 ubiquitin-like protein Pup [Actinopolyspora sp. BKK1]SDQ26758.1 prokaryotic ubiquitin-like protein Pup [Actinopolyspora saharensis]